MRVLHAGLEWNYWGRLEADCLDNPKRKQIAGGETAMLRAAFETAALGHEVHVITWCKPGEHRGVRFHDNEDFYDIALNRGSWDVIVVWGQPDILAVLSHKKGIGDALRVCAQQCNHFFITDAVQGYVDLYVSPSRSHAQMLSGRYNVPIEKFAVIPNGVEPSRFRRLGAPRNPFAVYHASSPDRGLHHLLELWPEVRRAEPRAELHVYYEFSRFMDAIMGDRSPTRHAPPHPVMLDLVARLESGMERVAHGHGVTFHGGRPQQEIADRACTAGVMCYPCDPVVYTEGFGTSVLEAYVSGARPVTTDADAFGDVYGDLFDLIPRRQLRERLVSSILNAIEEARKAVEAGRAGWAFETVEEGQTLQERYSWARVGARWVEALERGLAARREERRVAA